MQRRIVVGVVAAAVGAAVAPGRAQAQEAVVTGRVVSDRGQPVVGATVLITELGIGGLTNATGAYTLTVPAARVRGQNATLLARYIGFVAQRRSITLAAGRQTQAFTLVTDANRLSEIVVTGVSVAVERAKVPYAVQRITAADTPVPGVTPLAQLQGKVPGANIVGATGRPGASPEILLRGPKSFNATGRSQEPLYIVDGVILAPAAGTGAGPLSDINPQDIESVEVVSGTAAASLYGSQAANGVIQITTRRGVAGQNGVRFNVRSEYGINDIEREINISQRHALLMDPTQTRFCVSTGLTGTVGSATSPRGCARTVDWLEENLRINETTLDVPLGTVTLPIEPGSNLTAPDARRLFQTTPWPGANYNSVAQLARPKPLLINNVDMTGRFGGTDVFAAVNNTRQGGSIAYLDGYNRTSLRVNAGQALGTTLQVNANAFFSRSSADGSTRRTAAPRPGSSLSPGRRPSSTWSAPTRVGACSSARTSRTPGRRTPTRSTACSRSTAATRPPGSSARCRRATRRPRG